MSVTEIKIIADKLDLKFKPDHLYNIYDDSEIIKNHLINLGFKFKASISKDKKYLCALWKGREKYFYSSYRKGNCIIQIANQYINNKE